MEKHYTVGRAEKTKNGGNHPWQPDFVAKYLSWPDYDKKIGPGAIPIVARAKNQDGGHLGWKLHV